MKYYQHEVGASEDEVLTEMMLRWKSDAYAGYFITLEKVAKVAKVVTEHCSACGKEHGKFIAKLTAPAEVFAKNVPFSCEILADILHFASRRRLLNFRIRCNVWTVEVPKLLRRMDEYTRRLFANSGHCPESLGSDSVLGGSVPPPPGIYQPGKGSSEKRAGEEERGVGRDGGVEVGSGAGRDDSADYLIAQGFERLCAAPSFRSKQKHIRDALRQGASLKLLTEAPMNPKYAKMGFFKILDDILDESRQQKGESHGRSTSAPSEHRSVESDISDWTRQSLSRGPTAASGDQR